MIEFLTAPDHVLAFRLSGRVTGEEMDRLTAEVDARLKRFRKVAVVADLAAFDDMTAEAIAKDLAYDFSHIGSWGRFPRMAMVTGKVWLRGLVKASSALLPFIEARVFEPGQLAEALDWASDVSPQPA